MADTLVTFDGGTDEDLIPTGGGITTVSGFFTYEAAAAFHGPMGAQTVGAAYGQFAVPNITTWWGSVYMKCVVNPGSSSTRVVSLHTGAGVSMIALRFNATGAIHITNATNVLIGAAATTTWTTSDTFRFDWEFAYNAGADTCDMTVRIFKNANVEGVTPDETLTRQITGATVDPGLARVGSLTAGTWDVQFDTLRFGDVGWYGPYDPVVPVGTVSHVWSGTPTDDGFVVTARLVGATSVRLAVSTASNMASPTYVAAEIPDANGYVRFDVTGKNPDTVYYYQLADDSPDFAETLIGDIGSCKTLPDDAVVASVKVALGACLQGTQMAAGDASDALDDIVAWAPDFMVHTGDFYYTGSTSTSASTYRALYETQIDGFPGLSELLLEVPTFYCISDHECGPDNGDSDNAYNAAHRTAYQQVVPYAGGSNHYHTWVVGRTRFIMLDVRTADRSHGADTDNGSKTMLGATQKAWLFDQLDTAEFLKVIISDVPWMGAPSLVNGADKWWSYSTERDEIADYIVDNEINVDFWHGDAHGLGLATGATNDWGGFPVVCSAPLANVGGGRETDEFDDYYENDDETQYRQYMRITIEDDGTTITRTASGWDAQAGTERMSSVETWASAVDPPDGATVRISPTVSPRWAAGLAGTHTLTPA